MATLEKIRSKAVLLVVVIGVALFAFIIESLIQSLGPLSNQKKENIVVVNGEAIHYHDYQSKVEERSNALKRNSNRTFTDDEQNQIRQIVLNEMIDGILFSEETKKLNLVVSKDEYKDLVIGDHTSPVLQQMPDFQNRQTGQFDKTALLNFLQMIEGDNQEGYSNEMLAQLMEMKKVWLTIEEQIIQEQLKRKFNALISSAILTNDLEAKAAYENNKTSVDFDYVSQAYTSIPDDQVSVSDAEIQKLYNDRKTLYKQPEATLIDYIAVNILPNQADYQAVETKLDGLKEQFASSANVREIVQNNSDVPYLDAYVAYTDLDENLKHFVDENSTGAVDGPVLTNGTYNLYKLEGEKTAPDSVKFNILALPMNTDEKLFKNLTDSLIQVVKGGVSFADMASNATNGQTNGDMGWVTEAQLTAQSDAQLTNEVFGAVVNEPFVAKSTTGSFLVQVTEKTRPVRKYKIADVQVRVIPSQDTKTRLYNDISQFVSTNHSLKALKENAAAAGYTVQTDVEVTKDQINIGGIQSTRQIVQWAFNHKKDEISDIYECQNAEYFVVAAVEGKLVEGYRSLASVSDILKRELINEKKGEKLVADLQAKKFSTLEQYAEVMNTTPQSVKFVTFSTPNISGIGAEPVLNAKAPVAPVDQISGPYAGKARVYVINVTNKNVSEAPYDAELQKRQAQMQNTYRMYQLTQSPELLRENAKIDNHFDRFF
ncbi:MAG: SurA N-terminal domain-containing protein [Candidatus Symbiothrix sp.]|jgi:peptidyl-prolyl cis-trans isomerase D|nr:SurA N-terminal domain-containing protein [Candidatus Symbiothrix sp.]